MRMLSARILYDAARPSSINRKRTDDPVSITHEGNHAMGIALTFAILLGNLRTGEALAEHGKPVRASQVLCKLRVLSGDPIGSKEKGTLEILAQPNLTMPEHCRCSVFTGSEIAVPDGADGVEFVEIGHRVQIKTGAVKGGEIYLDITYTSTYAEDPTPERLRLHTESVRVTGTYKLGEMIKLSLSPRPADKQQWVELVVEEIKP
jgi:hypothetical protein